MVTASHNPPDYNGMKFVREQSQAHQRRQRPEGHPAPSPSAAASRDPPRQARRRRSIDTMPALCRASACRTSMSQRSSRLKIVVNAGNGGAGLDHRPARAASAVRVHQGAPRARRALPERHPESDARGEPRARPSRRSVRTAPTWASPGTATSTAASSSTSRAVSSRATTSWGCSPRCCCKRRARRARRARSAADLEHHRDRRRPRAATAGAVEVRPRLHQAAHARGRRRLWRRDERAPLLPPLRLLRQRHDSLAARRRSGSCETRPAALGAGGRAHRDCFRPAASSTTACRTRRAAIARARGALRRRRR